MKLTSGLVLKVFLALAPAIIGSYVTYYLSKDKAAGGYTKLSESVNELQGAVEELRLEVRHIQDLHFTPTPIPASIPAVAPVEVCAVSEPVKRPAVSIDDLLGELSSAKGAYGLKPAKALRFKPFKRVPLKLDDARLR